MSSDLPLARMVREAEVTCPSEQPSPLHMQRITLRKVWALVTPPATEPAERGVSTTQRRAIWITIGIWVLIPVVVLAGLGTAGLKSRERAASAGPSASFSAPVADPPGEYHSRAASASSVPSGSVEPDLPGGSEAGASRPLPTEGLTAAGERPVRNPAAAAVSTEAVGPGRVTSRPAPAGSGSSRSTDKPVRDPDELIF